LATRGVSGVWWVVVTFLRPGSTHKTDFAAGLKLDEGYGGGNGDGWLFPLHWNV